MINLCIYESLEENDSDVHYIKMNGREFNELMEVIDDARNYIIGECKARELYNELSNCHLIEKSLFDETQLSNEFKKGEE